MNVAQKDGGWVTGTWRSGLNVSLRDSCDRVTEASWQAWAGVTTFHLIELVILAGESWCKYHRTQGLFVRCLALVRGNRCLLHLYYGCASSSCLWASLTSLSNGCLKSKSHRDSRYFDLQSYTCAACRSLLQDQNDRRQGCWLVQHFRGRGWGEQSGL